MSRASRHIHMVDEHWSTKLLNMAKEDGDIGLLSLSDLIHVGKLALVTRFDQPGSLGRTLMSSVLGRNLNLAVTTPSLGREQRQRGLPAWSRGWVSKAWRYTYQAASGGASICGRCPGLSGGFQEVQTDLVGGAGGWR